MGALTPYLQAEFRHRCPAGWECVPEAPVLAPEFAGLLGYAPRADVALIRRDTNSRIWVEFEVSRADPVANHAKFATAHLFDPQAPADHFVAMLSPHIDRGRRNLAAATIRLMRRVGMSAFQTTLLPLATPSEVARLNQLPSKSLNGEKLDVDAEIERVMAVVTPVGAWGRLAVHLVGDLLDVFVNLRGWNEDLATPEGKTAWGKRTCQYFVYDPASGQFAPSKFCAYTPVLPAGDHTETGFRWQRMSAVAYSDLNDGTHVMDGGRAWQHLVKGLGMRVAHGGAGEKLSVDFAAWLARHRNLISAREGATFLLPPDWYITRARPR